MNNRLSVAVSGLFHYHRERSGTLASPVGHVNMQDICPGGVI